jgi:CheY-like chemotaxis protein
MRRPKALVIDDDLRIVDEAAEIFTSLGHAYQWAPNLEAARKAIRTKQFSYILLNLDVPARSKGGTPHLQNGMNLLEELCGPHQARRLPVIILLGERLQRSLPKAKAIDLVVALMQKGAASVIRKPLSSKARTLDRAIKKALIYHNTMVLPNPPAAAPTPRPVPSPEPALFKGGEMVFYADRVEICGVKIVGDTGFGQSRMILDLLKQRHDTTRYIYMSGETLAKKIGAPGGIGTVTGCIRTIRRNAAERLKEQLNLIVGIDDVIANDGVHGYCLREWITVRDATCESAATGSVSSVSRGARRDTVPDGGRDTDDPDAGAGGPDGDTGAPYGAADTDPVFARREQILAVLKEGSDMRAPAIAARTKCSVPTVKRYLAALRKEGVLAFVGSARTGHYRLGRGP